MAGTIALIYKIVLAWYTAWLIIPIFLKKCQCIAPVVHIKKEKLPVVQDLLSANTTLWIHEFSIIFYANTTSLEFIALITAPLFSFVILVWTTSWTTCSRVMLFREKNFVSGCDFFRASIDFFLCCLLPIVDFFSHLDPSLRGGGREREEAEKRSQKLGHLRR